MNIFGYFRRACSVARLLVCLLFCCFTGLWADISTRICFVFEDLWYLFHPPGGNSRIGVEG